eukprot:SAG25_NODE_736_length_5645_cov_2.188965_1_plen_106_part_00
MWPAGTEKKSFCFFAACGGLHPYDQYELVRYPVSADQNHFGHPPSFRAWVTRPAAAQLLRRPQIFTDHGTYAAGRPLSSHQHLQLQCAMQNGMAIGGYGHQLYEY